MALAIYNLASYIELNPLYGSVFIWVVVAIRSNIDTNFTQYTTLKKYSEYIAIFQALSMTALWSFYSTISIYDIDIGMDKGLFYS